MALARAIVSQPRILLLDEPLSALEWEMRHRLQEEIVKVHRQFGLTTIMVSHDVAEIHRLADQVVMLEAGRVQRKGTASEVFGSGGGKGQLTLAGEVLQVNGGPDTPVLSLLVGNDIIAVSVSRDTAASLAPGDRVWVSAQAVNPTVRRMDTV